jgi:arylsulfatase A-like enzyme
VYEQTFRGVVGRTVEESTQAWQHPPRPPAGSPNVVVIVLDDVGFAQLGCYGSRIDTPHMDGLAARGVRYTNFHTTALCSPTRAALLTGMQPPFAWASGSVVELPLGFPGLSTACIARDVPTVAIDLKARAIRRCFGKWHLAPTE